MNFHQRWLLALAALGMGTAALPSAGISQVSSQITALEEVERRACEEALRENTIEALEEFLLRHPNSSCRVLALNALQSFAPGGEPVAGPGPGFGGYGN